MLIILECNIKLFLRWGYTIEIIYIKLCHLRHIMQYSGWTLIALRQVYGRSTNIILHHMWSKNLNLRLFRRGKGTSTLSYTHANYFKLFKLFFNCLMLSKSIFLIKSNFKLHIKVHQQTPKYVKLIMQNYLPLWCIDSTIIFILLIPSLQLFLSCRVHYTNIFLQYNQHFYSY